MYDLDLDQLNALSTLRCHSNCLLGASASSSYGPKFGEPLISLKLIELRRSNLTRRYSHEQELGRRAKISS